jgi:hypothetical protein
MINSKPPQKFLLSGEIGFVNNASSIAPQEISLSPGVMVYSERKMINNSESSVNQDSSSEQNSSNDENDGNDLRFSTGNHLPKTCFSIFRKGVVNILFNLREGMQNR